MSQSLSKPGLLPKGWESGTLEHASIGKFSELWGWVSLMLRFRVNMYASAWMFLKLEETPVTLTELVLPAASLSASRCSSLDKIDEIPET